MEKNSSWSVMLLMALGVAIVTLGGCRPTPADILDVEMKKADSLRVAAEKFSRDSLIAAQYNDSVAAALALQAEQQSTTYRHKQDSTNAAIIDSLHQVIDSLRSQ